MLKEALEYLTKCGRDLQEVKIVALPGNKKMVVTSEGNQVVDGNRIQRCDEVETLSSLLDWCAINKARDMWVSEKKIWAVANPDDPHLRDLCFMVTRHSSAWDALRNWSSQKQKQAVRLMRGELAGTFDEAHLRVFRLLDFSRRNDGARQVSHAGETLGKSIEAKAQSSAGAIPERIVFTLPVFDFAESPITKVTMSVDVDPEAETISLFAVGDAFRLAINEALSEITQEMREKLKGSVNVYRGEFTHGSTSKRDS